MVISSLNSNLSQLMGQAALSVNGSRAGQGAVDAASPTNVAASTAAQSTAISIEAPRNMLSDLFVQQTTEPSKYLMATLNSLDLAEQMRSAIKADSFTLVDAMGGLYWEKVAGAGGEDTKYTDAIKDRLKAERLAEQNMEEKTVEASKPGLEQTREDIEEAAEADGQDEGVGAAPADEAEEGQDTDLTAASDEDDIISEDQDILAQDAQGETIVQAVERVQVEEAASESIPEVDPATGQADAGSQAEQAAQVQANHIQATQIQANPAVGSRLDLQV